MCAASSETRTPSQQLGVVLAALVVLLLSIFSPQLVTTASATLPAASQSDAEQWFETQAEETYFSLQGETSTGSNFSIGEVHQLSQWAPACTSGSDIDADPELSQTWVATVTVEEVMLGVLTVSDPGTESETATFSQDAAVARAIAIWEDDEQFVAETDSDSGDQYAWFLVSDGSVTAVGELGSQKLFGTAELSTYCQVLADNQSQASTATQASAEVTDSGQAGEFPLWIPVALILLIVVVLLLLALRHERRVIGRLDENTVETELSEETPSGTEVDKDIS